MLYFSNFLRIFLNSLFIDLSNLQNQSCTYNLILALYSSSISYIYLAIYTPTNPLIKNTYLHQNVSQPTQ